MKNKKIGEITITDIKEHKDGSATLFFEYNKELEKEIKTIYNIKRLSKKRMSKILKDLFMKKGGSNHLS